MNGAGIYIDVEENRMQFTLHYALERYGRILT
jgi:hypothetical protein